MNPSKPLTYRTEISQVSLKMKRRLSFWQRCKRIVPVERKNTITDVGGTAILESLQFNSSLNWLDLGGNNISEELLEKIKIEVKSPNRYGLALWMVRVWNWLNATYIVFVRMNTLAKLCCGTIAKHQELYNVSEIKQTLPKELFDVCFSEIM